MSTNSLPLGPRLTLIAAVVVTPAYFFGIRIPELNSFYLLLHLIGILLGCVGLASLLVWNALLQRKSLIAMNTFFTIWMFVYFTLILLRS
jgi:hypothetical protein